ncbi:hypothetical protein MNBD_GAMMA08-1058, partial [hydrothermal vent metagenome]
MGMFDAVDIHESGNYKILIGSPKDLVKAVDKSINDGWMPVGSAVKYAMSDSRMSQTMMKH